jgi:surface antigen
MRAAGGYLQPVVEPTPATTPDAVAVSTASIPVVDSYAALFDAAQPAPAVPEAPAAAAVVALPAVPAPPADYEAPDFTLPPVQPPTSRRALREAQAALSVDRAPRDRPVRTSRPEKARVDVVSPQGKKLRERLTAAGVMVLVGGLFAGVALPAYADSGSGGVAVVAPRTHGAQALGVTGTSLDKASAIKRDSYSATSAEDLRALYASALRQKNLGAFLASGSASKGNDYPWPSELSRNQGGGLSPLGYYYRECVDFVAWRLNRDAGVGANGPWVWTWSQLTPSGGNASQWKAAWVNHGWPTGATPKVGAVAWFPGQNHVAYVSGILQSGEIVIDEYNMGGRHEYDQRVISPSTVEFLYAPPR